MGTAGPQARDSRETWTAELETRERGMLKMRSYRDRSPSRGFRDSWTPEMEML